MSVTGRARAAVVCATGLAIGVLAIGAGVRPPPPQPGEEARAAFEALKGLEGTWLLADEAGAATDQVGSIYHVTAGGSALVETMFPGAEHEMVTVYYVERDVLKMTHYCMLGNRPVLTSASPTVHEMSFECSGAECCAPERHMHAAVITIVDESHVTTTWSGSDDNHGDPHVVFQLIRKGDDAPG